MYDTIREDNDHIVEIYISLCAKCSCRVEKCVCSKTCTREHSAPASAQNILPRSSLTSAGLISQPLHLEFLGHLQEVVDLVGTDGDLAGVDEHHDVL